MMIDLSAPVFFSWEHMCSESYLFSIRLERLTQSLRRGLMLINDLGRSETSIVWLHVEYTRRELDVFSFTANIKDRLPSGGGHGLGILRRVGGECR